MSIRRRLGHLATAAAALAAGLAIPQVALGQVRNEPQADSFINPGVSPETRALFERSGIFMIAGGVLPAGHAAFLLEQGGSDTPVPAQAVQPSVLPDGSVVLTSGGASYHLGMPAGLACPLGQFVARDGLIAYTVPKYMDPDSRRALMQAGLAQHHIAREFANTQFAPLLRAADFGNTVPLQANIADQITKGINHSNGLNGLIIDASFDLDKLVGSYLNSDMQVTYRVYLEPGTRSVEVGGVPLRYYWTMDNSGVAGVFSVEMYAQDWPAGTRLTDLTVPGAKPTQYDIVNFYQVAAVFRALHETNNAGFMNFVSEACQKQ
jgi:hypothetical protein